jgi:hypothetical protein
MKERNIKEIKLEVVQLLQLAQDRELNGGCWELSSCIECCEIRDVTIRLRAAR